MIDNLAFEGENDQTWDDWVTSSQDGQWTLLVTKRLEDDILFVKRCIATLPMSPKGLGWELDTIEELCNVDLVAYREDNHLRVAFEMREYCDMALGSIEPSGWEH